MLRKLALAVIACGALGTTATELLPVSEAPDPLPVLNAIGTKPRLATKVVISTGLSRVTAA